MYADRITDSMERAIDETNRRRAKQVAYNEAAGVDPQPLRKKIADITDMLAREDADTEELLGGGGRQQSRGKAPVPGLSSRDRATAARDLAGMPARDLAELVQELTDRCMPRPRSSSSKSQRGCATRSQISRRNCVR
jgi:excinuclease ABC subunit B